MKYLFCILVCISLSAIGQSRSAQQNLSKALLSQDSPIPQITAPNNPFELQVSWTQINKDPQGNVFFDSASYQADAQRYFYPASTAKLPIAIMALEKIRALQSQGFALDEHTPFEVIDPKTDQIIAAQKTVLGLIQEIFLVSDNDAYNYLFDFLGRDKINERLQELGLTDARIHHKFLAGADNENTWKYRFYDQDQLVYSQESLNAKNPISNAGLQGLLKGVGFMLGDSLAHQPMDFTFKNYLPLEDLVGMVKRLVWSELFPEQQRWKLNSSDLETILYWMGRHTLESEDARYTEANGYWDSYNKFLIYGDTQGQMRPSLRIYNKIGQAYGTLTDIAYIQEGDQQGILAVSLLVNENGIFNDDQYQYDTIGLPFLGAFGRTLWAAYTSENHP